METKMRIKLYGPNEQLISDRLVEQATEFYSGPKEAHKGPLALEVNLRSQEDIENIKTYLDKLSGNLPLTTKAKSVKIAKGTIEVDDQEPLEDLLNQALKKYKTQEELIKFLREQNFKFITSDMITEGCKQLMEDTKLEEGHEKYQYLIRLVKEAKDPKNDKYDPRLMVGIKLYGKKFPKMHIYLFGKFNRTEKLPWADEKKINFKKPEKLMKFPDFMDYEDRAKWRVEWRKLLNNPELEPTKFYNKYKDFVIFY